jgi:predicted  nucleic acid-binding Zn-ribbon protein
VAEIAVESILTPAVFIAIGFILWNSSRKITSMEKDIASVQKAREDDKVELVSKATEIHKQVTEEISRLELKISEAKVERKEDIIQATAILKNELAILQKQIDGIKIDIKEQSSRVTQNDTKIQTIEDTIKEIKEMLSEHTKFFTVWIQRVEDRIENLRKEFIRMFTAFHGEGENA